MTTDTETLLALAERCEQATGPDYELDYLVGKIAGFDFQEELGGRIRLSGPHYTASIDAAMSLVPEGFSLCILAGEGSLATASLCRDDTIVVDSEAAAPALALTAACLRALAGRVE